MKVNKQNKIKVNKSGFKRSKFNWTHDVNTTFNWGEIQPTQCKMLIPGSKTTMQAQNLIRLAPMVAPTFGRVKYKTYNQFVSMAEIFPNWDAMMAQEPKSTSFGTKVPQAVPTVTLGILSSWVLFGARATIYACGNTDEIYNDGAYQCIFRDMLSSDQPGVFTDMNKSSSSYGGQIFNVNTDILNHAANNELPDLGRTLYMEMVSFGGAYEGVYRDAQPYHGVIPLAGENIKDLFPIKPSNREIFATNKDGDKYALCAEVTLERADYVIEYKNVDGKHYAVAFELSDIGKRIRKVLQGCGYQINFTSQTKVSILPLLAQYKAYFDIFGLQLYKGWETTYCAKMIQYIEQNFIENCDIMFCKAAKAQFANYDNQYAGVWFILQEIANMWYTDDADYVGAHIRNLAVGPGIQTRDLAKFLDTDDSDDVVGMSTRVGYAQGDDITGVWNDQKYDDQYTNGGHANITNPVHGQLDSEMLKRLYRWTNRNTILGRRIAEILRAQGLGKYVDECKSYYIGSTDTMITISDVISTADTDDGTGNGAVLGEYGGKGLQYSNDKVLSFENDVYGYWITLATVVPEAGYTQGLDPTLTAARKMDFYVPDFDAMGMEATPKENIVGNRSICNESDGFDSETFGFVPKMTKFKVANNLVNGDFNRHGLRNVYMPYTLDKQININDFDVLDEKLDQNEANRYTYVSRSRKVINMPVAGDIWRYPTKYAWLGNFNRIFRNVGDFDKGNTYGEGIDGSQAIGYRRWNDDNFLSHGIYEVNSYAPMKPIEDSYGLDEDDSMNAGAEFVSKA